MAAFVASLDVCFLQNSVLSTRGLRGNDDYSSQSLGIAVRSIATDRPQSTAEGHHSAAAASTAVACSSSSKGQNGEQCGDSTSVLGVADQQEVGTLEEVDTFVDVETLDEVDTLVDANTFEQVDTLKWANNSELILTTAMKFGGSK
ncbi:unnamed protein product [Calypogeia fissa]